ncbi:DNA polymerase III subunit gamma and tau [Actinokineospora sp. HUAS TT18]|uniref:DNA polymerase III subunit gamma and tau n=1 Tax=Actinokineospora sp. HUAS TT18 TaxID=3447451 RepID=UPI003F523DF8
MALALYRKYRPATFAEVVGQEHVTDPLRTALSAGRVNHAYLFSGPRGCGKTSSARILARSLNCVEGPTDEPCGVCDSCVGLAPNGPGTVDVVELDAASHGGVDDARELRDRAFYAPAQSRYRVFIVDEAHMVTTQGFNALLKIVEEPPEHLVFIFATTEPEKVLPTIRSRTHHYPFRLIPPGAMRELLERNCAAENATVEPAVFPLVIRAGGGSARDTQSVLDQLLAGAGPEGVTYERAVSLLGVTDVALIDDMVDGLAAGDASAVYGTVDRLVEAGHDPRRFASDLLDRLRDLVLLRAVPDAASRGLVSAPGDELDRMTGQAERLGGATLTRYAEIVHTGLVDMRGATAPRLLLELLCARMLLPGAIPTDAAADSAVLQRLEQMEKRMAGAQLAAPATRAEAPPVQAGRQAPAPEAGPTREFRRRSTAAESTVASRQSDPAQPAGPSVANAPAESIDQGRTEQAERSLPPTEPARQAERPSVADRATQPPRAAESAPARSAEAEPAAAAPAQAAESAPGAMDATAMRNVWPEVLRALGKVRASMLAQATVQSVDGDLITIGHPAEPLARRLSSPDNIEPITAAVRSAVGGTWRVQIVHAPPGSGPVRTQAKAAAPTRTYEPPKRVLDSRPPADGLPPEPPEPELPPEPEDEEELMAQAARAPEPGSEGSRQDPEETMLKLLAEKLGARPLES